MLPRVSTAARVRRPAQALVNAPLRFYASDTVKEGSTEEGAATPTKPSPSRPGPRRRPDISLSHPRKWNRPVRPGAIPAYDEALRIITADSKNLQTQLHELRHRIQEYEASGAEPDEIQELKDRAGVLEVQSMVNLPGVRWKVANGMGAFST